MPPGRKPSHSREEFIEAAITYADDYGIDALTLRALGSALGMSSTALYRYFPDKGALVVGMRERLLSAALSGPTTVKGPCEALRAMALAYRAAARRHPCLSQIMSAPALEGDVSLAVPTSVGDLLGALGLRGSEVAMAYRQLESFTVGTCAFDFAGAPHHLADRWARIRQSMNSQISTGLESAAAIDDLNERAFEATLDVLLGSFVAVATAAPRDLTSSATET